MGGGAIAFMAQLLPLIPDVAKGVSAAVQAWNIGTGRLKTMVAENRDPTAKEWAELNAELAVIGDDLHTDDPDEIA